ncbi:phosphate transport system substrate-binding protein [Spirosomataceae bacterium TFI 002]|nr:phosphate transport system substrate-binding protein [Spirosomataceae bacterium TFI 002]
MKTLQYYIILLFLITACSKADKAEKLTIREGKIKVAVDESFKYIADAQIDAYKMHYPKTEFEVVYTPEQKAIGLMLSDSVELAIVSRELDETEQKYFTSRELSYLPGHMAVDAVALIVNTDSQLDSISMAEIKSILLGTNQNKNRLVFDNSSSSNLNMMLKKFEVEDITKGNISAAKGTNDVFEFIENSNYSIGVIGNNWISDSDDPRALKLRSRFKVLAVSEDGKNAVKPSTLSLEEKTYPLTKTIYLHTTQDRWGVAKGFVRFACSQVGQLVVEKMGLQPYYIIPKNYSINPGPNIITVE